MGRPQADSCQGERRPSGGHRSSGRSQRPPCSSAAPVRDPQRHVDAGVVQLSAGRAQAVVRGEFGLDDEHGGGSMWGVGGARLDSVGLGRQREGRIRTGRDSTLISHD